MRHIMVLALLLTSTTVAQTTPSSATGPAQVKPKTSAPATAQRTQQRRKSPVVKAGKPATAPAPAPPEPEFAYPPVPSAPEDLTFLGHADLKPGDVWSYLIASGNTQWDGKMVRFTLSELDSKRASFAIDAPGQASRSVSLDWNGQGRFSPVIQADGNISIKLFWNESSMLTEQQRREYWTPGKHEANAAAIVDFPFNVKAGRSQSFNMSGGWEQNFVTGQRKTWPGSDLEITGPQVCVVPAGSFACARFALESPSANMVAHFAAEQAAALMADSRPPAAPWMFFELHSYRTAAGVSTGPTFPDLPAAERQKALDWIRGMTQQTSPRNYDPVTMFLVNLHSLVRAHPRDIVRISLSPGLTNDGKGYIAEWKKWKFSTREMTPDEAANMPRQSMATSIGYISSAMK